MVDGSYSQFKATKGRKADRDFKKGQYDKKKLYFNSSGDKGESKEKRFSHEEIESTKKRMREKIAKDRRKQLLIVVVCLVLMVLTMMIIIK
jgi:hypothetical protein